MANKKVKKTAGELPADVVVGDEVIKFGEDGEASVSVDIAEKLEQIPGYEVAETAKKPAPKKEEPKEEAPSEDAEPEEKPAPRKPAPKKPAPKK